MKRLAICAMAMVGLFVLAGCDEEMLTGDVGKIATMAKLPGSLDSVMLQDWVRDRDRLQDGSGVLCPNPNPGTPNPGGGSGTPNPNPPDGNGTGQQDRDRDRDGSCGD